MLTIIHVKPCPAYIESLFLEHLDESCISPDKRSRTVVACSDTQLSIEQPSIPLLVRRLLDGSGGVDAQDDPRDEAICLVSTSTT